MPTTNPIVGADATRISVMHPSLNSDSKITAWYDESGVIVVEVQWTTTSGKSRAEAFEFEERDGARDTARTLAHAVGTRLADESEDES